MQTTVAIVGGGLAGLYAARLLDASSIDFQLFEARDRFGGRILSVGGAGHPSEDGFDLGPSWFWPGTQPALAALTRDLGLPSFPQHSKGDVLFERKSRERVQRVRSIRQQPESMRLAGGTGALVAALAASLPQERLHLHSRLTRVALEPDGLDLWVDGLSGTVDQVRADQLLIALPPRLAAATISFTPALDPATAARWETTSTWMAPHAKFFAIYEQPFWREMGLSGTAQSMVGPLVEIHDATTHSGSAALFGFLGVTASKRAEVGEQALTLACVAQLARLFGDEARRPRATLFKDWAADPLTATEADQSGGGHPIATRAGWVTGPLADRLSLGNSETSMSEPGLLAGAIDAAKRAVTDINNRLGPRGSKKKRRANPCFTGKQH